MKKLFLFVVLCATAVFLNAQKADIIRGNPQKVKKITDVLGTFTVGGKPFIMVGESTRMIVDQSVVFFPVEDDMSLGQPIRPENVNTMDGQMEIQKCIYLENIIVSGGKTLVYYVKRDGNKGKLYYVEMEDDCQINQENATELMDLDVGRVNSTAYVTVRQSPDRSKILLVTMDFKSQKTSDFKFRVYSAGMKEMLWEKAFKAPEPNMGIFYNRDDYNSGTDPNNWQDNFFLVNNSGEAFFLCNRTNVSETKADYSFIHIDAKGGNMTESEIEEPGNWVGSNFFRLDNRGRANFIFFYSASASKVVLQVGEINPVNTNTMRVVAYNGKKQEIIQDHTFTNDEQALFYPAKNRKAKADYKISEFSIEQILQLNSGELVMVMGKGVSTVGNERPFSNAGNGYTTLVVLDSAYNAKQMHSYVRVSYLKGLRGIWMTNFAYLSEGKLHLLYINDKEEVQCLRFTDMKTSSNVPVASRYPSSDGYPVFSTGIVYNGGVIFPILDDKEVAASFIKI